MRTVAFLILVSVTSAAPKVLSAEEVFKKASASVVLVVSVEGDDRGAQGSGVVVDPHTVVTNWHVVKEGQLLGVKSAQGEIGAAVLVAEDETQDLALLRVLGGALKPTRARTRSVAVGQTAFAIGAPEGLELTISQGIVSQVREVAGQTMIQTSAAISHGSSGGGLFDDRGELVGITTLSIREGQALNFAIPAEDAFALASRGFSKRAVLGLCTMSADLTTAFMSQLNEAESRQLAQLRSQYPCHADLAANVPNPDKRVAEVGRPPPPNLSDPLPTDSREKDRVYLRVFSTCAAEITPGGSQLGWGEVLLVPFEVRDLTVGGDCAGFAELYFGRDVQPRVADNWGRNQPLRFRWKK